MSFTHGIIKDVVLESGVTVGYHHLVFYMNNDESDMLSVRLNAYLDKASAMAGKKYIDIMMTDNIMTQFNYPKSLIDSSQGHELGLLNYIVANEPVFVGGTVE